MQYIYLLTFFLTVKMQQLLQSYVSSLAIHYYVEMKLILLI